MSLRNDVEMHRGLKFYVFFHPITIRATLSKQLALSLPDGYATHAIQKSVGKQWAA